MTTSANAQTPSEEFAEMRKHDWRAIRYYYALAFGITWGVGGLCLLASMRYPGFAFSKANPLFCIAAFGPTIGGLVMVGRIDGRAAIGRLVFRARPRRSSLYWYLVVIVGFVAAHLLVGWITGAGLLAKLPRWDRLLYLLPITLVKDTGPLGEEFGWRGFALPRLLRLGRRLPAALALGAVWAVWHLPTFFIPTLSQSRLFFPVFALNSISLSVIMTWLYLRTAGDLFLMILVHLMANYCGTYFDVPFGAIVLAEVTCAALIIVAGGLRESAGVAGNAGRIEPKHAQSA